MLAINWPQLGDLLVKMLAALVFSLPVAWNRERSNSALGLRTFPLVAMVSCAYVIVGLRAVGLGSDAQARIIQGLMTGIGFVGGGAILREEDRVFGMSTAASIWAMGCVGAAAAYGYYDIALAVSLISFLVFRLLTPVRRRLGHTRDE